MTDNKINRCNHYWIVYATEQGPRVRCGICKAKRQKTKKGEL